LEETRAKRYDSAKLSFKSHQDLLTEQPYFSGDYQSLGGGFKSESFSELIASKRVHINLFASELAAKGGTLIPKLHQVSVGSDRLQSSPSPQRKYLSVSYIAGRLVSSGSKFNFTSATNRSGKKGKRSSSNGRDLLLKGINQA
jgi:hypothetical protein